jgi:hypothetical protein
MHSRPCTYIKRALPTQISNFTRGILIRKRYPWWHLMSMNAKFYTVHSASQIHLNYVVGLRSGKFGRQQKPVSHHFGWLLSRLSYQANACHFSPMPVISHQCLSFLTNACHFLPMPVIYSKCLSFLTNDCHFKPMLVIYSQCLSFL